MVSKGNCNLKRRALLVTVVVVLHVVVVDMVAGGAEKNPITVKIQVLDMKSKNMAQALFHAQFAMGVVKLISRYLTMH